jgi:hypothetical protein
VGHEKKIQQSLAILGVIFPEEGSGVIGR